MIKNILKNIEKYKKELKLILILFIFTRLALMLVGVFSFDKIGDNEYFWHYSDFLIFDIWGMWDSGWYLDIAKNWYTSYEVFNLEELGQTNFNFFPLYPSLMRIVGILLLGNYFVAGILVSNFFLIVSAVYLYKLVRLEYDEKIAKRSLVYLFLAPASFILSGVFTESLFLALALIGFYYAKTNKWFLACLAGFFLALTKSLGVLIALPLFYVYLRDRNFNFKKIKVNIFNFVLIPLGTGVFSLLNYIKTGDYLAFAHSQQVSWGHKATNPIMEIVDGWYSPMLSQNVNAVFTVILLLLFVVFFKKIKLEYWIYSMMLIFVHLFSGACMNSMFRYAVILFPYYILLALIIKSRKIEIALFLLLAIFQCLIMAYWVNGFLIVV